MTLRTERLCAETTNDIVVFAIGMRINRFWKVWKWFPVCLEMPRMLKEQEADPSIGLLSTRFMFGFRNIGVLQHWRSAEDLNAYAHSSDRLHLEAWKRFGELCGERVEPFAAATGGDDVQPSWPKRSATAWPMPRPAPMMMRDLDMAVFP